MSPDAAAGPAPGAGTTRGPRRALIDGPEYTVAILGERCLPPIRIEAAGVFYDFDAKYRTGQTQLPHSLRDSTEAEERELAVRLALAAFRAVDCGRVGTRRRRCAIATGAFSSSRSIRCRA
jgi:hypothetical protein